MYTIFLAYIYNQLEMENENSILRDKILQIEKQLQTADRLAVLGEIAAGIAHEIKNPLTAIKGMVESLIRHPNDPELFEDFIRVVPKEIDRLRNLVEQLAHLGRPPRMISSQVDINTILENTLLLFESRGRREKIKIIKELNPLPEIKAYPEQLMQAFINFILNAFQAMPSGGKLEIRTLNTEQGIQVIISDSGHGIPEDKLSEIFEPFYTTKEKGSGLGLAITHRIISDHGGEITVESSVGKGTLFKIILP